MKLGKNIKGANKDAKIYVRKSMTVHNLLLCAHTLCISYAKSPLLLFSSSVWNNLTAKKAKKKTYNKELFLTMMQPLRVDSRNWITGCLNIKIWKRRNQKGRLSSSVGKPELLFDNNCTTISIWDVSVHWRNNIFFQFCKNLSCNFYIAPVVLFWPDSFGTIKKMGNEKDFDSRIWSKENMVMILVRMRSAVMRALCKFFGKPGCQLILDWQVSFRST